MPQSLSSYLRRFLVPRNDKLYENIVMKTSALAPIEVEILLWRGSPQKIETDCFASSLFQARVRD